MALAAVAERLSQFQLDQRIRGLLVARTPPKGIGYPRHDSFGVPQNFTV
jgi:hypothetical protein